MRKDRAKKLIAVVLAVMMCATLLPADAFADELVGGAQSNQPVVIGGTQFDSQTIVIGGMQGAEYQPTQEDYAEMEMARQAHQSDAAIGGATGGSSDGATSNIGGTTGNVGGSVGETSGNIGNADGNIGGTTESADGANGNTTGTGSATNSGTTDNNAGTIGGAAGYNGAVNGGEANPNGGTTGGEGAASNASDISHTEGGNAGSSQSTHSNGTEENSGAAAEGNGSGNAVPSAPVKTEDIGNTDVTGEKTGDEADEKAAADNTGDVTAAENIGDEATAEEDKEAADGEAEDEESAEETDDEEDEDEDKEKPTKADILALIAGAELDTAKIVNPIYDGILTEADISDVPRPKLKLFAAFKASSPTTASTPDEAIYMDINTAGAVVRESIINRAQSVKVYFSADTAWNSLALAEEIYSVAVRHTGVPDEGDYFRYEYGGYALKYNDKPITAEGDPAYYYYFTYYPEYYTTAAQEAEMAGAVNNVLNGLGISGKSDYEKVRAIYNYLCSHVTYDNAHVNDTSYVLQFTGYGALINGTAVCQGYAVAFYRLCLTAGVNARIISGKAMCHAWNIAKVNGAYYELDATWDAGKAESEYRYFLRGSSYWLANHGGGTLGDQYSGGAFAGSYPIPADDFRLNEETEEENPAEGGTTEGGTGDGEPGEEPQGEQPGEEPQGEQPGEEAQGEQPGEEPQGEQPGEEPQGEQPGEEPTEDAPDEDEQSEDEPEKERCTALVHHEEVPPTCTEYGMEEHWECTDCGKLYLMPDGTGIVSPTGLRIPPTGHEYESGRCIHCGDLVTYHISYELNDGTAEGEFIYEYTVEQADFALPELTKAGYDFAGWCMDAACRGGSTRVFATATAADVTLYAKWTAKRVNYDIVFDGNGATGGTTRAITNIAPTQTATLTANAFTAPAGTNFAGWALTPGGDVAFANRAKVSGLNTEGGTVTLYAVWAANSYTVTFNGNGGKYGTASSYKQTMTYNATETLLPCGFTKPGYTFAGWGRTSKEAIYADEETAAFNLTDRNKGSVTLYAVWTANPYTIRFDLGGAGMMDDIAAQYGMTVRLPAVNCLKPGYSFKGWAYGGKTYTNKASVKNLSMENNGLAVLSAVWAPNAYNVRFNLNGGRASAGTSITQQKCYVDETPLRVPTVLPVFDGYEFAGWCTAKDGNGEYYTPGDAYNIFCEKNNTTMNLYAIWKSYVTVRPGIGSGETYVQELLYNCVAAPDASAYSKEGYTFVGWNTTEAYAAKGTIKFKPNAVKNVKTGTGLYAVWKPISYKVNFHANNGTASAKTQSMTYDKAVALTANGFSRSGYKFLGWALTPDGMPVYANREKVMNLASAAGAVVDLYAVWG